MDGDGASDAGGLRLTPERRAEIGRSVLLWLATLGEDGTPSVSPKEVFCPGEGDVLLVADIASPGSVRNIRRHPLVGATVLDIFRQTGLKLYGRAEVVPAGAEGFAALVAPLSKLAGPGFPIRGVIRLEVARVVPFRAPSYRLFPERDEAEQMRRAYATYGVRPDGEG